MKPNDMQSNPRALDAHRAHVPLEGRAVDCAPGILAPAVSTFPGRPLAVRAGVCQVPHRTLRVDAFQGSTEVASHADITKTAAWLRLGVEGRARVMRAMDRIATCGLTEDPWLTFREAIASMFDGAVGAMYTVRDGRVDFIAAPYPVVACRDVVERHARWTWDQPDRTANRAVSTSDLYRDDPEGLLAFRAALDAVAPGIAHHGRVAIYEHGRMTGWYGVLRGRAEADYDSSELLQLQALLPVVRPRISVMRLLEHGRPSISVVTSVMAALSRRARLVDERGRKLHGNALDDACDAGEDGPAVLLPLFVEDRPLFVELRSPATAPGGPTRAKLLGESMRGVADAWSRGQDVTTIAARMGLSEGTVRTYVKRAYRKLGVSSRTQLMAALASPVAGCSDDE